MACGFLVYIIILMSEEVTLEKIAYLIKESEERLEMKLSYKIDQKIETTEHRMSTKIEQEIKSLQTLMMQGFSIMDTRFDRIENRLERIEANHGARIRALENKVS